MDTDSFILDIKIDDVYKDMKKNIGVYDTSNFSKKRVIFKKE